MAFVMIRIGEKAGLMTFAALAALSLSSVGTAQERRVDPDKVGQLLCRLLSEPDIPKALGNLGAVKYNGNKDEPEWEIESDLFDVSYAFSRGEEGPENFSLTIGVDTKKAGALFQNGDEAEKWLSRLGTQVIRETDSSGKEKNKKAVARPSQGTRKVYYHWEVVIKTSKMNRVWVYWMQPRDASEHRRICQAFP
jgi:hypothetical protein